ncbi:MAG: glycerophosphodiester phosphodiesterase [Pseudohongiellaceae bacterium]
MLRFSIVYSVLTGVLLMATGTAGASDSGVGEAERKIVVAHRGASAYLPEHTLPAVAMAYAMGADFMEQDVVMTRDDELIVWHDLTLDRNTDVAQRFPGRAREDGEHYVIDFTLEELRRLQVTEGYAVNEQGEQQANYPDRFPLWQSTFRVHTLAEQLEMVQGMNRSMDRDTGIYPEIKDPAFHREHGKDLSRAVLSELKRFGYDSRDDNVYVQTFDHDELKRVHDELYESLGMELKLVQLIGGDGHDWMVNENGMEELGRYADGVGPHYSRIIDEASTQDNVIITDFVRLAHRNGMAVHPYTFRADEGQVPGYARDFRHMLELFYEEAGIDGAFTDFPDRVIQYIQSR